MYKVFDPRGSRHTTESRLSVVMNGHAGMSAWFVAHGNKMMGCSVIKRRAYGERIVEKGAGAGLEGETCSRIFQKKHAGL